jgi:uncharacterized OB-fold protein
MPGNKSGSLRLVPFAGAATTDSSRIQPLATPEAAPYREGLCDGLLNLQVCGNCGAARLPGFPRCPWCRHAGSEWRAHSGRGRMHSWTRYHRAFMSEFECLVPYAVAAVQLENGPMMFGRVVEGTPEIGGPAQAVIEEWRDGFRCIAFCLEGGNS